MKRMEQMKFMDDLNWKMYSKKLDDIFHDIDFIVKFNHFLPTEFGQKWLKTENGQKYMKWQES